MQRRLKVDDFMEHLGYAMHVANGYARVDYLDRVMILSLTSDISTPCFEALQLALLNAKGHPIVYSYGACEVFSNTSDAFNMATRHVEAYLKRSLKND